MRRFFVLGRDKVTRPRIGFAYDPFRGPALGQWDARPQAHWLQEFLTPAMQSAGWAVAAVFADAAANLQSFLAQEQAEGGLANGTEGWSALYGDAEWRSRLARPLRPMLFHDLIVGYEMTANQIRFLGDHQVPFMDIGIDSIRFVDEALFRVRSNSRRLVAALTPFAVTADHLAAETGFLLAQLSRGRGGAARAGDQLVFVGQTDVDTSLIVDGRISGVAAHIPAIQELMRSHRRLLLLPHPLARNNQDIVALLTAFPHAVIGRESVYEAISHPATKTVVTMSSSVADEAELLGRPVVRLLRPDASPEALGADLSSPYIRIDRSITTATFWRAVLEGWRHRRSPKRQSAVTDKIPSSAKLRSALGIFAAPATSHRIEDAIATTERVLLSSPERVNAHCLFGWSGAEPSGVWSDGPVALLGFDIGQAAAALEIGLAAFIGVPGRVLELALTLNCMEGDEAPTRLFRFENETEIALVIPLPEVLRGTRCHVHLRFTTPLSPAESGISGDTRRLGVQLRWMRLVQESPEVVGEYAG